MKFSGQGYKKSIENSKICFWNSMFWGLVFYILLSIKTSFEKYIRENTDAQQS